MLYHIDIKMISHNKYTFIRRTLQPVFSWFYFPILFQIWKAAGKENTLFSFLYMENKKHIFRKAGKQKSGLFILHYIGRNTIRL